MAYVLSLDEGTTSARAILFDPAGQPVAIAQREFAQHFPRSGWVEHDAEEIWTTQVAVALDALRQAKAVRGDVAAVGITNQRETTVVWDRAGGRPIHKAIVWQDRRTAQICDDLRAQGCEKLVQERTGLLVDSYFSATKIAWILDHVPQARARAEAGELAFGTIDAWLTWKLTGGTRHVTDVSNAARTMLFNIHTRDWDDDLLRLFRVPRALLPEVRSSSEVYGTITAKDFAGTALADVPVAGIAGDQQAALFGQMCVAPGLTKNTYGTGCFLLQNTGKRPVPSRNRLLTTIAWQRGGDTEYALEGSVFMGGAVVQWLREGLGIIKDSSEIEAVAATVPDNGGLMLVPAFAGLGAPHWDPYARGILVGLTRGTAKGHIARAALEGIAFQVADLLEAMAGDAGKPLTELRVDGGASRNNLLMQFQADILGVPVVRPALTEATALGAAYLAGLTVGLWKNVSQLEGLQKIDRTFQPAMPADQASSLRARWKDALERAKNWAM